MNRTCVWSLKVDVTAEVIEAVAITKVVSTTITIVVSELDSARLWQLKKSYCLRQMDRTIVATVGATVVVVGNCCSSAVGHVLSRIRERSKTSCGSQLWAEMHCSD